MSNNKVSRRQKDIARLLRAKKRTQNFCTIQKHTKMGKTIIEMRRTAGIFVLFMFTYSYFVLAAADKNLYDSGVREARAGSLHFAFMHFSELLREFPDSAFTPDALFATGEYYYSSGDYRDAKKIFSRFVAQYPDSPAALFASSYLVVIARYEEDETIRQHLERGIVTSKQISLLFRDSQEFTYVSSLTNVYRALYFIDKVEIYIDENLFLTIPF